MSNLNIGNLTLRTYCFKLQQRTLNALEWGSKPRRAKSGVKMCHLILREIRPVAYLQKISLWNKF